MSASRLGSRSLVAALAAGGATVGLAEGVVSAVRAQLDGAGALACAALVTATNLLLGLVTGALVAAVCALARWGRVRDGGGGRGALGWILSGAATAGAVAVWVGLTALRRNRFLAGGLVCAVMLSVGVLAALLGPALARVVAGDFRKQAGGSGPRVATPAGLLIAAPLVAGIFALVPFLIVSSAPSPLRGTERAWRMIATALLAAPLPWALVRAARLWPSLSWVRAALAGVVLYVAPAAGFVAVRWVQDFRYLPWPAVGTGAAIIVVASGWLRWLRDRRLPSKASIIALFASAPLAFAVLLVAGGSEAARKAASQHAGLVEPVLAQLARAFDRDGDGYARMLGGGDCDDGDRAVNPGANDVPEDGIDQDCDGKDADITVVASPLLHAVPDAIPRDLDVLFITIDTLRADHLGCYGYARPTSPEIDKLAAVGIQFDNGWAHAPSTRFSMPFIATSRWNSAVTWEACPFPGECDSWWPRFSPANRSLGEVIKGLGYTTGAFFAYSYFRKSNARGFERGIDFYDDRRAALHENIGGDPAHSRGSSAREMSDDGIAFLDAHRGEKFFLWLHYYDPHLEYEHHPGTPEFGSAPVDGYDHEIRFTDTQVGRVLTRLHELGLWDKTAILLTGDHGEGLGERGINAHGYHLYAPQTKVPFIARVPGLPPRRVREPVGHVDIAPTLINLARGPQEKSFLGRSAVDLMTGSLDPAAPRPFVYQDFGFEGPHELRGMVSATHHLIWNQVPQNTTECYDLVADPGETRDLWGSSAGLPACVDLKRELRAHMSGLSLPADFRDKMAAGVTPPGRPAPEPTIKMEARFGTAVRFAGYDLPGAAPNPVVTVKPGAQVDITYHFEVQESLPGWRLFVHLLGPNGFYGNFDHVPVDGAHPVERWQPGQHIRDHQVLTVPASAVAGDYVLALGFWRAHDRLQVTPPAASDGDRRLQVVTLRVE